MIFAAFAMLLLSTQDPNQGVLSGRPQEEGGPLLDAFKTAIEEADRQPCDELCVQARKDLNVIYEAAFIPFDLPCEGTKELCAALDDVARNVEAYPQSSPAQRQSEASLSGD